MLATFVRREFSAQRRGHLYALAGDWDSAVERWGNARSDLHSTPTFHERVLTQEVIRRLRDTLKLTPRERADALFRDALGALFGVGTVFRCCRGPEAKWTLEPDPGPQVREAITEGLSTVSEETCEFSKPGFVGAFVNPTAPFREALVVLDSGAPLWLHREMRELVHAYAASVREERRHEADKAVRTLEQALTSNIREILSGLYVHLDELESVLARALRALFGVLPLVVAEVWLVSEGKDEPQRVARVEAAELPNSEPEPSQAADVPSNTATDVRRSLQSDHGTFHSFELDSGSGERKSELKLRFLTDTPVPDGQLDALRSFAAQLGAAVAQFRRLFRVNSALDSVAEPIVILDRAGVVAFSNEAAKHAFNWAAIEKEFGVSIEAALSGQRIVEFPESIEGKPYEGNVLFEPLKNARVLLGAMVHVQPKSYYAHILNAALALERATSREKALESLVEVFSTLGHQWIRVYRLQDDCLVPERCVDPLRPAIRDWFNASSSPGFPKRDESSTWIAVNSKQPQVVAYMESMKDGDRFVTPLGLTVIAQPDPPEKERLGKLPGDYWIDFPLLEGTRVVGKFTIPCDERLTPERLQMFNVLAKIVGDSFARVARREAQGASISAQVAGEKVRQIQGDLFDELAPLEILREAVLEPAEGTHDSFDFSAHAEDISSALDRVRARIEQLHSLMQPS